MHTHDADSEKERYANPLFGRQQQLPDNALGDDNEGDVRDEIHHSRGAVEHPLINTATLYGNVPNGLVRRAGQVESDDVGNIKGRVEDEDCPTYPEESIPCAKWYEDT